MFVMTVDQRRSRRERDRVPDLLARFADTPVVRSFDRTAGDEVQAVVAEASTVVDITLVLAELGTWSIGIGAGAVEEPLPAVTRAGRGPAFEAAREAVTLAKHAPGSVCVRGPDTDTAADAAAVLSLLAVLVARRSPEGRAAVEQMRAGRSQSDAAEALAVTKQAVSQRLAVAGWQAEAAGRRTAIRLVERVDPGQRGAS
ncbi:hypothetical protein ASG12_09385 [Williamsia sp. Leaf354]|uniref:hypothetical protein n=1 Tax=Williamsia sp. Leaf354 TaxID=1736349 RepID=UPI0006F5D25A|nr:hypothetical protein [Williamsia sp. Leaf354]KQR98622.1 hypothetical protein ASG12_09385 [Williamsia sp. Leaf354]